MVGGGVGVGAAGGVGVRGRFPAGAGMMVAGVGTAGVGGGVGLAAVSGVGTAILILFQMVVVGMADVAALPELGAGSPGSAAVLTDWGSGLG